MPAVGVFRAARPGPPPQPARELAGHGPPGGSPNGHRRRPSGLRLALLPGGRLANRPPRRETAAAGAPRPSLPRRVRWCGLTPPGRSRRRHSPCRRTGGRAAGQPSRHPRPRRHRRVRRDQPALRQPRPRRVRPSAAISPRSGSPGPGGSAPGHVGTGGSAAISPGSGGPGPGQSGFSSPGSRGPGPGSGFADHGGPARVRAADGNSACGIRRARAARPAGSRAAFPAHSTFPACPSCPVRLTGPASRSGRLAGADGDCTVGITGWRRAAARFGCVPSGGGPAVDADGSAPILRGARTARSACAVHAARGISFASRAAEIGREGRRRRSGRACPPADHPGGWGRQPSPGEPGGHRGPGDHQVSP